MGKVNNETLWRVCKDIAKRKYGLLYEEENTEEICNQYAEITSEIGLLTKIFTKSSINRNHILNLMINSESIPDDVENVREGVYFIPVVFNSVNVKDMLINDLQEMFNQNIVVSNETIRKMLNIPFDESKYFIDKLRENKLVKVIAESQLGLDYFAIGNLLSEAVDTDPFAKALSSYANNGLVSKSDLDNSTEINLTTPIMRYFEQENLLCRANAKPNSYLIVAIRDDFSEKFIQEISSEIQVYLEKNNFAMTEVTMRNLSTKMLNELYGFNDDAVVEYIVEYVNNNISDYLRLSKQGRGREIFTDTVKLNSLIEQQIKVIKNLPVEVENDIMSEGDSQQKLRDYISEKVSELNLNKDKIIEEFIEDKIIDASEELIVEAILPSVDIERGDSNE